MKNEFIPYEQALELKELGFDEPCFGKIYADGGSEQLSYPYKNSDQIGKVTSCSAPLYQQVFRWFREKHNLYVVIVPTITMYWTFKTITVVEGIVEVPPYNHVDGNDYPTYEEAELEGIKYLISILKYK